LRAKPPKKAFVNFDFLKSRDARTLRILSEYEYPAQVFRHNSVRNTVVFFGSSRVMPKENCQTQIFALRKALTHSKGKEKMELREKLQLTLRNHKYCHYYEEALELSRLLTTWSLKFPKSKRILICSGGGPGIMEAANRGAYEAGGESIGLNISLPFEQQPNPYITPKFNFEFHYFYMRKLWFMYYAKALIVFPGGFGTMDELLELLTLVQTQKVHKPLLILLYGKTYWKNIIRFDEMVKAGMISKKDLELFTYVDTPKTAFYYLKKRLPKMLV
jgi:hypothetical protein